MNTFMLFACLTIGTLWCVFSAQKKLRDGKLFSAFCTLIFAVSGVALSVWAAFLYLPLWGAILYTILWVLEVLASIIETIKERNNS